MTLFLNKIVSSIFQIIISLLLPFIWWFILGHKQEKFTTWMGLKKLDGDKKKIGIAVIAVSIAFMLLGAETLYLLKSVEKATSEFAGLRLAALPAIFVYAVFNTALPEELFFRGFVLKRVAEKYGFIYGNCIQAILFAILHGILFLSIAGIAKTILITIFTGICAYAMGYVNEKIANGSIIPSWTIHSLANIFSGICASFLLI